MQDQEMEVVEETDLVVKVEVVAVDVIEKVEVAAVAVVVILADRQDIFHESAHKQQEETEDRTRKSFCFILLFFKMILFSLNSSCFIFAKVSLLSFFTPPAASPHHFHHYIFSSPIISFLSSHPSISKPDILFGPAYKGIPLACSTLLELTASIRRPGRRSRTVSTAKKRKTTAKENLKGRAGNEISSRSCYTTELRWEEVRGFNASV